MHIFEKDFFALRVDVSVDVSLTCPCGVRHACDQPAEFSIIFVFKKSGIVNVVVLLR